MRETSLHRPIDPPPGSLRHPPRHCRVPGITSSVRWGSMPNRARLFAQPEKTARQEDDRDELLCLRCCVYGERAIGIRTVCSGRLHWHIRAQPDGLANGKSRAASKTVAALGSVVMGASSSGRTRPRGTGPCAMIVAPSFGSSSEPALT